MRLGLDRGEKLVEWAENALLESDSPRLCRLAACDATDVRDEEEIRAHAQSLIREQDLTTPRCGWEAWIAAPLARRLLDDPASADEVSRELFRFWKRMDVPEALSVWAAIDDGVELVQEGIGNPAELMLVQRDAAEELLAKVRAAAGELGVESPG
jgi:hypothetical protein